MIKVFSDAMSYIDAMAEFLVNKKFLSAERRW